MLCIHQKTTREVGYFTSLEIGKRIHCCQWKVLPVSEDMIGRVHQMTELELQPKVADNFKFEWRLDGVEIDDVVDDDDDEVGIEELLQEDERLAPQLVEIDEEENEPDDTEHDGVEVEEINDQSELVEEEGEEEGEENCISVENEETVEEEDGTPENDTEEVESLDILEGDEPEHVNQEKDNDK